MNYKSGEQLTLKNPIPNINFGDIPEAIKHDRRAIAEEEARRDLTKSYEQLLADSHHEITDQSPDRNPTINLGFSNRRLGGIYARAAMAMEKSAQESSKVAAENIKLQEDVVRLTEKLRYLTIWIMILTILMTVLAPIAAYSSGKLLFNDIKGNINTKQTERDTKPGNDNSEANKAIESPKDSTKAP